MYNNKIQGKYQYIIFEDGDLSLIFNKMVENK